MSETPSRELYRPLNSPLMTLERYAAALEAAAEDLPDSLVKAEGLHAAWDARDLKEKFARGEITAEKASKDLMLLYWLNQDKITGTVVAGYMANIGRDFGQDAGMSSEDVSTLWEEAQEEATTTRAQDSSSWTVIE